MRFASEELGDDFFVPPMQNMRCGFFADLSELSQILNILPEA